MVQRFSILLRFAVLLFVILGCSPEDLKIHVPPTGLQSVNQEDLRRAYWALEQGADPVAWWDDRAVQFHLQKVDNCWRYSDQSDKIHVVVADKTPMPLTIMASLAKAVDKTVQDVSWQFCLSEDTAQLERPFIDLKPHDSPAFTEVNFTRLAKEVQVILENEMGIR